MASNISTGTIDTNFPVAGRDNDSQGFRDNFSQIEQNFVYAKAEINDLQVGVARKDADNDFGDNVISGAVFVANTQQSNTALASGTNETSLNFSWNSDAVHVVRLGNGLESGVLNVTATLIDWPANNYASMRFIITRSGAGYDHQLAFTGGGASTVKTDDNWPAGLTDGLVVDSSLNPYVVEAFTYDAGVTIFLKYIGQFS